MIDAKLPDILACPACKGPLDYWEKPESLACMACRKAYPFENGVPALLADRASALQHRAAAQFPGRRYQRPTGR